MRRTFEKRSGWSAMTALALAAGPSCAWALSNITAIDFRGTGQPQQIEITADGPLTFQKQENPQDNQVVLELSDARIPKSVARKIDTSSFNSNVTLISPYQVTDQPDTVRVVLQLRQPGAVDATSEGNKVKVTVGAAGSATAAPDPLLAAPPALAGSDEPSDGEMAAPKPAAAAADGSPLGQFVEARNTRRYSGKPITLNLRDVDVVDAFRVIGEASGFNIILADDVKGKVTISLAEVPWDQALDTLLRSMNLGAERNNNVLRVATLRTLTQEKQNEIAAAQAAQASAPRITKIFPISYAKLGDLAPLVQKFAPGTAGDGQASPTTVISVDERTNSLIVRDIPENLERIKAMVELLDTQTPQVLIEAKVIEASEEFGRTIGGSFGMTVNPEGNLASMGFSGANPYDQLFGEPGVFKDGKAFAETANRGGLVAFSPNLSFLPGGQRLNAILNMGEQESQVKIVASPRIVVMNKEVSAILQQTPILVSKTVISAAGVVTVEEPQVANLSMEVQPTVTNEGSVLLKLRVANDNPTEKGVGARNMTTNVLVDNGSTLVIGGIFTNSTLNSSSGFPWLRKIPILGVLFGSETNRTVRSELFFFITPRILNTKEAGLAG